MAASLGRDDEAREICTLMRLAQDGDKAAFDRLQAEGQARGISYTSGWSSSLLLRKLRDRASAKNQIARAAVAEDLEAVIADLSSPSDGPIERLIVKRAALCVVDAGFADTEHLWSISNVDSTASVEAFERRRDRAHRRLLSTLKALCEVRRMNRPAVQVNVGDGNVNILTA